MKYFTIMLSIRVEHGHLELVKRLINIMPEGMTSNNKGITGWRLVKPLEVDSDLMQQIIKEIEDYGLRESKKGDPNDSSKYYIITRERRYSKRDMEEVEFFRIEPKNRLPVRAPKERHEGMIYNIKTKLGKVPYITTFYGRSWVIISAAVRKALLASDLKGYFLRPTLLKQRNKFIPYDERWELCGVDYMPVFVEEYEEPFSPHEYHYRRSEIGHVRDVAHWQSKFNHPFGLIVSKRFYDWWNECGFKHLEFIPCRIHEE